MEAMGRHSVVRQPFVSLLLLLLLLAARQDDFVGKGMRRLMWLLRGGSKW